MCNCTKRVTNDSVNHVKQKNPKYQIGKSGMLGVVFQFDKNFAMKTIQTVEYEYTFQKVDGSTSKVRTGKISVGHTYCPFCGKEYS